MRHCETGMKISKCHQCLLIFVKCQNDLQWKEFGIFLRENLRPLLLLPTCHNGGDLCDTLTVLFLIVELYQSVIIVI